MTPEVQDKDIVGGWGYGTRMGKHFYMHCTNDNCCFRKELPIQIIDEELYRNPPTLLFGTVDKYAMMTWIKETGAFFASNSDNRPPELIIQDELHLISGSLGTMVGLYESVIDALCEQKGIEPKEISLQERLDMILKHMDYLLAFKVEKVAILELRSHAAWYLKGISGMNDYKKKFFQATTKEDIIKIVKEIKENGIC